MKFAAYVVQILLCESCKFCEKISYSNWDNEFFLRDCFLLAHPVGELSVVTIIDASCTTSFALNSGVTEPNLTKISRGREMMID